MGDLPLDGGNDDTPVKRQSRYGPDKFPPVVLAYIREPIFASCSAIANAAGDTLPFPSFPHPVP